MPRSEYKQNIYVDENNGPSPMQLTTEPFKDTNTEGKIYYENDRERHLNSKPGSMNKLQEAKRLLYSKPGNHDEAI